MGGSSWPAVVVWGAATAVVVATCAASGYAPGSASTWARWDSGLYLDIASHGYTLFHCGPPHPSAWCGNAGWFGAYPLLVAAGQAIGLPPTGTGVALAWLFGIATIVLLWHTFLGRRLSFAAVAGLAYAAFAPGQVYDYAVFPLSMLAFFTVLHLWLLSRGRRVGAGLAGAVAAATYPLGVLLLPVAAIRLLARGRIRTALVVCGLAALGPAVLVLVQWLQTGRADAYFLVQHKYGHGLREPLGPVLDAFGHPTAPNLQTLLLAAVGACVLVELVVRRASVTRAEWLVALWAALTWLLPNLETNLSINRSQAALLPLAVLVRRLPRPLVLIVLVAAVGLAIRMEQLFLDGTLV